MAVRIDKLAAGQDVVLKMHGSKQFGNDPYEMDTKFVRIQGEGDERRAEFEDVTLYRDRGRWAYGTSAEKATVLSVK